ncbi:MAG: 30S ribosomal protein S14 [Candidatus Azosocius agrarius]|nr:MAG: 30S ribosomal protein S14 [Gammaproteobacteria bacterium]
MSSNRMIERQARRKSLFLKYFQKRSELRFVIKNPEATLEEKENAQYLMQNLPKDSNKCRLRNRCFVTGRGNGVYSRVGLCRNMFRFYAMRGDIPGIRKASW